MKETPVKVIPVQHDGTLMSPFKAGDYIVEVLGTKLVISNLDLLGVDDGRSID